MKSLLGRDKVSHKDVSKPDVRRAEHVMLTPEQFLNWGAGHIAYIRPMMVENKGFYALHAADGRLLSVEDSEEGAAALAHESHLLPVVTN